MLAKREREREREIQGRGLVERVWVPSVIVCNAALSVMHCRIVTQRHASLDDEKRAIHKKEPGT
jgi:hypothetical protein